MSAQTSGAPRTLSQPILRLGWATCAAFILLALTGITFSPTVQLIPFAISMLFLGLPHGAVDHLVPFRLLRRRVTAGRMAAFVAGYVLVALLYLAAWFVAPAASATAFIVLTWFHWGQGDVHALLTLHGATHVRGRLLRGAALVVRGGLPMLVPLLAFPQDYLAVVGSFVAVFQPERTVAIGLDSTATTALSLLFALLMALYLGATSRQAKTPAQRRAWRNDAAEIGLLSVFFVTVPPILAIGLYFCCWHALRHIGRLMVLDADARSLPFRWRDGVRRFVRDSAPLTVVSLLFMGLFFVGVGQVVGDSAEWPAVYLVLISALTLPHTLVVWWMDVRDGIWQSAPTALPAQHAADAAPTG